MGRGQGNAQASGDLLYGVRKSGQGPSAATKFRGEKKLTGTVAHDAVFDALAQLEKKTKARRGHTAFQVAKQMGLDNKASLSIAQILRQLAKADKVKSMKHSSKGRIHWKIIKPAPKAFWT